MVLADWIATLGDLPQAAIERACAEWLTYEERRPTPAGIRKRAVAFLAPRREDAWPRDPAPAETVVSEEELARRREMWEDARRKGLLPRLKRMTTLPID